MYNTDLMASVVIKNKNNVWVPDENVTKCNNCESQFGVFWRRHHCRNCGNIFCANCSNNFVEIPEFINDKPKPADNWSTSNLSFFSSSNLERICDECNESINKKNVVHNEIKEIFVEPTNLQHVWDSNEIDPNVKDHYINHFRNIQYYLPNHEYTKTDRQILKSNYNFIVKHSKYVVHLIKSLDWKTGNNNENITIVNHVINGEKIVPCNKLCCTRSCATTLCFDDAINILYSCTNVLPQQILKLLLTIINETVMDEIILCHLIFFVSLIKSTDSSYFHELLVWILTRSDKLLYQTCWFLDNAKETATINEKRNIGSFIGLMQMLKKDNTIANIYRERSFFVQLIENLENAKGYLAEAFSKTNSVHLPCNPSIEIIGVDLNSISVGPSKTKPTFITFITTSEKGHIKLLFKKECVLNDVTTINLIRLTDIIFESNTQFELQPGIKLDTVTYNVMPITSESGMIEIVEDAETLDSIYKKKYTLHQAIFLKNKQEIVATLLLRYTRSLISYSLNSYFIGLRDRHLHNIMITDDGRIFHIDFGFFMGNDASAITTPDIKLISDMFEIIDKDENLRSEYINECSRGSVIIRKHFNLFFILLTQGNYAKANVAKVEKFVLSRFQPRQTDEMIISEFIAVINNSNDALSGILQDFLHYHSQERTVQNSFGKVVETITNVFTGVVKTFT